MPDTTFPTADRWVLYEIDGRLYEKFNQRDAITRPDAIRAICGDAIIWLVPTGFVTPPAPAG